jgi:flavin reductase (DIM6/NTAB) family NADH-FMN oxidoreductase RutF
VSEPRSTFAEIARILDYQMFIVTTAAAGERSGCLVGFASQASIRPPRFLVALSRKNHTFGVAEAAQTLVVHLVSEDDEELAELFGGSTGDEVDKFARCRWTPGPDGAPVLDDLHNWFAGSICERIDLGDHVGFLLAPIDGQASRDERPFTFHRARVIEPGHAP